MTETSDTRSRVPRRTLGRVNRLVVGAGRPSGADSGMGQGMEMALTIAVFLGIGWLIDSWIDTRPIFTIALVVFAMVGQSVRMWIEYEARMKALEQERRERSMGSSGTGHR